MVIRKKIKSIFCNFRDFLNRNNAYIYNVLLSLLCIFAFFTPDYILKMFKASNVRFELSFAAAFFFFGLILSMLKNKKIAFIVVGIFFVFEAIQLHYMAYFGKPITPPEIKKIFLEKEDIIQSGFSYFFAVWYVLPSMLITYSTYLYCYNKFSNRCYKTKVAYVLLIIVLAVKPERAYRKSLKNFLPGPTRNSIHNTLNTFSYFFAKEIWNDNIQLKIPFKEYKIEKIQNYESPDIVIFLVAESMNYINLSLYGYTRETTPNLNKLKNNKNFFYRKAISGSISTSSALPFLFNVIREPGNLDLLTNKKNNLINLARQNNYNTYFFTSQESKTLNDLGVEFLDDFISRENDYFNFTNKKDDLLLEYLSKTLNNNTDRKKFISIFQRNLHSPYDVNYKNHKDRFDIYNTKVKDRKTKIVNSYDNAVLYEDYFISKIIDYVNAIKNKSVVLIITADHGQMLGEDNMFGHNMLDYRVASVPFMVYYNKHYKPTFNSNNIPNNISHYEISKFIANILGYNIINPNENNEFFIQGSNIYYDNFILPFTREENDKLKFENIDSSYNYFKLYK